IRSQLQSDCSLDAGVKTWNNGRMLPHEAVVLPLTELPEPERDNNGTTESVKKQEMKCMGFILWCLQESSPLSETDIRLLFHGQIF
uniref:Uncharacterized protein n=1 Tax=Ailuropoda melanoleuca TaxID=9646 RepID=A0A7N5J863_AILME